MANLNITLNAAYEQIVNPIFNINVVGRPVLCATVGTDEPITLTEMGLRVINTFFDKSISINNLNHPLRVGIGYNFNSDIITYAREYEGKKFKVWFKDSNGKKHTSNDWTQFDIFNV